MVRVFSAFCSGPPRRGDELLRFIYDRRLGSLTENLYKPLRQGKSDAHYLWVGRGVGLLIVVAGIVVAFWMPNVVEGLKIWLKIAPMLGVAFWVGLFWRRFNSAGAWASTLAAALGWWAVSNTALSEPVQILWYLGIAVIAGVIASLATKRPSAKNLDRFHELIRTPVQPGEQLAQPCHLPEGVAAADRKLLFAGTDFEFPIPSRISAIGFFLAWLAVGTMIGGFYWMVSS